MSPIVVCIVTICFMIFCVWFVDVCCDAVDSRRSVFSVGESGIFGGAFMSLHSAYTPKTMRRSTRMPAASIMFDFIFPKYTKRGSSAILYPHEFRLLGKIGKAHHGYGAHGECNGRRVPADVRQIWQVGCFLDRIRFGGRVAFRWERTLAPRPLVYEWRVPYRGADIWREAGAIRES